MDVVTLPREILPDRYYLLTRRCADRQFLLRPGKITNAVFEFLLAEAAALFSIEIVAWTVMSNHYHAVVRDPLGRLPHFLERFHMLVARALNAHWGRWECFWSGSEPTCVTQLVTLDDVFDKVVYVLANPVVDHLVDLAADWPGSSSVHMLEGQAKRLERPQHFFRSDSPIRKHAELETVPACAHGEDTAAWAARVRGVVKRVEDDARRERRATGQAVVGRRALLAASFLDRPKTHEPRRTLRPNVACKDAALRRAALRALKAFRYAYREARQSFVRGLRDVEFPAGTWALRWAGVSCTPASAPA